MTLKHFLLIVVFHFNFNLSVGQTYFMISSDQNPVNGLNKITLDTDCNNDCSDSLICILPFPALQEITMGPDGNLYIKNEVGDLYKIDTLNCNPTIYFEVPIVEFWYAEFSGLVSPEQDIFYSIMSNTFSDDTLFKIDVANNQLINLGAVPYKIAGDLILVNGDCFYISGNALESKNSKNRS